MGDQLSQGLGANERKEHVQKVPERSIQFRHGDGDESYQKGQDRSPRNTRDCLCQLVGCRDVLLIADFLVDNVALHDGE